MVRPSDHLSNTFSTCPQIRRSINKPRVAGPAHTRVTILTAAKYDSFTPTRASVANETSEIERVGRSLDERTMPVAATCRHYLDLPPLKYRAHEPCKENKSRDGI